MSGFEALSMVCSIMQVISFTKEVLTLCKDVYDGHPTNENQMEENITSVKILLEEMNRYSDSIQKQTRDEKELYAIAQKCSKAAQELQKEIGQVTKHHKPGDYMKSIIAVYTTKIRKRKITGLYDQFCQYQKTLETHILVRMCTKSDAIEIQRREYFTELSDTMKYFITQLAAGHTETANLIARDGSQIRQHIQQSEARVKQSINDVHNNTNKEAKRDRFLRSLKYESMNSRRTELKPAHEATYVSIFKSLDIDEESDEVSTSSSAAAWRKFVQWLQSDKRVFWIQGKPGAGKSTLMKFLIQQENTQRGVNKWSPNTLIVSHFFWKPGDILQKNLRGLLCSLIHQLLFGSHGLVDHILSEFLLAVDKDTIGDWETAELKSIFRFILFQYKRSIIFFIDGLDEATETEELFQFLDSFIGLHNVKVCMSSRDEHIFLQRFSKYDGFKLHELTRDDMLQFALVGIPETDGRYPSYFLVDLRRLLVCKAEGVYLWLVIALESVKRGLRNNDAPHEIYLRLSKLPSKLEELYADMWGRLEEDKDIYQKAAARYFGLLLMNQSLLEQYNKVHNERFEWKLSPFQIMLTTNEKIKGNMLDKLYPLPVSEINKKCADSVKSISIKTAGLLSITRSVFASGYSKETVKAKKACLQLNEHITGNVNFIHRTLFDFFKESEVGKSILEQSQTIDIDVELATIILCQLRTMQHPQSRQEFPLRISNSTPLHYFNWISVQLLAENSDLKNKAIMNLLCAADDLFEAGLLPWDNRPKWYPHPSSDLLLISNPVSKRFIQSRVEEKGTPHATCILREFLLARADVPDIRQHIFGEEESILSLGGDINSAGICLYEIPQPMFFFGTFPWINVNPEFVTYESILSLVIKRVYTDALFSNEIRHECVLDLVAGLEREPDLNKRTSFVVGMRCRKGFPYRIDTRGTQLKDLLYTIALLREAYEKGILGQDSSDTEDFNAFMIMEVNLKYLVEQFFEFLPPYIKGKEKHLADCARQLVSIDSCKPYVKALFFIKLVLHSTPQRSSMACYRFVNQNIDILADCIIKTDIVDLFYVRTITPARKYHYLYECEKVDVSTLSVLADERLGVCRLEDMGIQPPS